MDKETILNHYPKLKTKLANGEVINVALCTPMYGGIGLVEYFLSLMRTEKVLSFLGIKHIFYYTKQESLIQRARNTIVGNILIIPDVTHIFFIDGDIKWNEMDVLTLLENDVDIVGGIYPKKSYNLKKVLDAPEIVKTKNINKYNENVSDDAFLKHHLVDYNLNTNGETKIENGLIEVRHIATGFMMIKRQVFEKMIEAHPEWEYDDDIHNPRLTHKFYSFFDCIIKDRHYLSEDWTFCDRWTEMGGKIYANITIGLTHIGTVEYEGRILSTLAIN